MTSTLSDIRMRYHGARLSRDKLATGLLSTIIGEIESKAVVIEGAKVVAEETSIAVIKSFLKKNQELQTALGDKNSEALAVARREQEIIEAFLPKQLDASQIHMILLRSGVDKNMGIMMKYLKDNYSGQYDGKVASEEIKRILA